MQDAATAAASALTVIMEKISTIGGLFDMAQRHRIPPEFHIYLLIQRSTGMAALRSGQTESGEIIMPLNECCSTDVVCCTSATPIADVASLMRTHHIGDVVVVDELDGLRIPVGIVTDRDIVIETIALDVDASAFTAGDLMIAPLAVASENATLAEVLQLMRTHKVRRIPLVSAEGSLRGIVTTDDIIKSLAGKLSLVADAIGEQQTREEQVRK